MSSQQPQQHQQQSAPGGGGGQAPRSKNSNISAMNPALPMSKAQQQQLQQQYQQQYQQQQQQQQYQQQQQQQRAPGGNGSGSGLQVRTSLAPTSSQPASPHSGQYQIVAPQPQRPGSAQLQRAPSARGSPPPMQSNQAPAQANPAGPGPAQRRQSEVVWSQQTPQQPAPPQPQRNSISNLPTSSTQTMYIKASSAGGMRRSDSGSSTLSCPSWGPNGILFPPQQTVQPPAPQGLASLYYRSVTPPPSAVVPFAPSPHPPQNICQDPSFFELYKAVWASGYHPIHDGIERPAVMALLPAKTYWFGRRFLDIGCGVGKLCRMFRSGLARQVVGIDSSSQMLSVAWQRAEADDAVVGGPNEKSSSKHGVGSMLKKLFMNDDEHSAEDKSRLLERRQAEKAKHEEGRRNSQEARLQATAAAGKGERDGNGGRFSFSKLFHKDAKLERQVSGSESGQSAAAAAAVTSMSERSGDDLEEPNSASSVASSVSASPPAPVAPRASAPPVQFIHSSFEEWNPQELSASTGGEPVQFDCITCCMTLQFIFDLRAFAAKVAALLAPNGLLVLSVDHPCATAAWGIHPIVVKSERNPSEILYFPLDCYMEEGERTAKYYIEGVRKFHRTVATYVNTFLAAGLMLERMVEPRAASDVEGKHPELRIWRRKPIFLCLRFRKPKHDDF